MHFLSISLIAFVNNIDVIVVIIAYSIRGIKISTAKNIWICIITFFFSSLSAFLGSIITSFMSKGLSSILSMILLTTIGLWIIFEPYLKKKNELKIETDNSKQDSIYNILKNPENADSDNSNDIDFKEATLLGIALSIDNVGGGISAGMIGLNPFFVGIFSAIISFSALWVGNYITNFLIKRNVGNKATLVAGIVLILLGVKQII
jgi:putative sporulation protein YtaF